MPSRPLSHDRQLEVLLGAMIQRAGHNANDRSVQEDLDEILATADRRCDLLSEAVGLRTLGWDASSNVRQRELSEHFVRLDLPGIEEWFALARERAQQGNHTADGFAPRTVDLPGVGLFRPGELPGVQPVRAVSHDASREMFGTSRMQIHDGQLERFRQLAQECVDIVRTQDSGTLEYRIYVNEAGTEAFVHERYRDSDAGLEHMRNIGRMMEPLSEVCTMTGEVCGDPSPELLDALTAAGVTVYGPLVATDRQP